MERYKAMTFTIDNIRINALGTASFTLKIKPMRKPQEFITYPINTEDTSVLRMQSANRCVTIDTVTGGYRLSPNVPSYPTFMHCNVQGSTSGIVPENTLITMLQAVRATAGAHRGANGIVFCDNSGAGSV